MPKNQKETLTYSEGVPGYTVRKERPMSEDEIRSYLGNIEKYLMRSESPEMDKEIELLRQRLPEMIDEENEQKRMSNLGRVLGWLGDSFEGKDKSVEETISSFEKPMSKREIEELRVGLGMKKKDLTPSLLEAIKGAGDLTLSETETQAAVQPKITGREVVTEGEAVPKSEKPYKIDEGLADKYSERIRGIREIRGEIERFLNEAHKTKGGEIKGTGFIQGRLSPSMIGLGEDLGLVSKGGSVNRSKLAQISNIITKYMASARATDKDWLRSVIGLGSSPTLPDSVILERLNDAVNKSKQSETEIMSGKPKEFLDEMEKRTKHVEERTAEVSDEIINDMTLPELKEYNSSGKIPERFKK